MQQYDIRIQHAGGGSRAVSTRLPGDVHAILCARRLADEEEDLEVWRGMDCIYRRETLPHCRPRAC